MAGGIVQSPSLALREVFASAPDADAIVETLELTHPLFTPASHYFTKWPEEITLTLEGGGSQKFIPFPYNVQLPQADGQGRQDLQLSIANVDRIIVAQLQQAITNPQQRIEAVLRVYLLSDLTAPAARPIRLRIDAAAITMETVSAVAGRADVLNRRFSAHVYRPERFPGLMR